MERNNAEKTYTDPTTGKFAPGNPGRPKGSRHMSTLLNEAIRKIANDTGEPQDVAIVKKVIERAKEGDMKAIEHIWDRMEGKAPQAIDVTSNGETITGLTEEQKSKLDRMFL